VIAKFLNLPENEVYTEYFGLNHLGWTRAIKVHGKDLLPELMASIDHLPIKDLLPFSTSLLKSLQMIPNEYLYYYYYSKNAVNNILRNEQTRGEEILAANTRFYADLTELSEPEVIKERYTRYLEQRRLHYMQNETGKSMVDANEPITLELQGGYADVALRLIRSIERGEKQIHIVNTLNQGAIHGLPDDCVVEVPCVVGKDMVQPVAIGDIPLDCLGLLARVKAYEQLTIAAAVEGSTEKAIQALTIHPLVADEKLAATLVANFKKEFGEEFLAGVK
jgi:6-phospho-beta-glucosidase